MSAIPRQDLCATPDVRALSLSRIVEAQPRLDRLGRSNCSLMRLPTRGAALALMLLLGQFMLVGSGYACLGRVHADVGMSAQSEALSMSVRAVPDEHAGCGDAARGAHRMLRGFTCTALGACGVAPMTSVGASGATIVGLTCELVAGPPGTAATRSVAPELPPPRA